jgi:hypothetical protein
MPTELTEIESRCDAIEQCYEFMLGYAGKGLPNDEGTEIRQHLRRAVEVLSGLAIGVQEVVENQKLQPQAKYQAFLILLERDASDSLAALELVLAQPIISSQLIDNLNASSHLRALLTDLFLLSQVLTDRLRADPLVAS